MEDIPISALETLSRLSGVVFSLPSLMINIQTLNCALQRYSFNSPQLPRLILFTGLSMIADISMGVAVAGWVVNHSWPLFVPIAFVCSACKRVSAVYTLHLTFLRFRSILAASSLKHELPTTSSNKINQNSDQFDGAVIQKISSEYSTVSTLYSERSTSLSVKTIINENPSNKITNYMETSAIKTVADSFLHYLIYNPKLPAVFTCFYAALSFFTFLTLFLAYSTNTFETEGSLASTYIPINMILNLVDAFIAVGLGKFPI